MLTHQYDLVRVNWMSNIVTTITLLQSNNTLMHQIYHTMWQRTWKRIHYIKLKDVHSTVSCLSSSALCKNDHQTRRTELIWIRPWYVVYYPHDVVLHHTRTYTRLDVDKLSVIVVSKRRSSTPLHGYWYPKHRWKFNYIIRDRADL